VFLLSPKSCANPWSESGVDFRGVDPRVLFILSCPGVTGALDRSDRCKPLCGICLE
jgi:hypothetical protein